MEDSVGIASIVGQKRLGEIIHYSRCVPGHVSNLRLNSDQLIGYVLFCAYRLYRHTLHGGDGERDRCTMKI